MNNREALTYYSNILQNERKILLMLETKDSIEDIYKFIKLNFRGSHVYLPTNDQVLMILLRGEDKNNILKIINDNTKKELKATVEKISPIIKEYRDIAFFVENNEIFKEA